MEGFEVDGWYLLSNDSNFAFLHNTKTLPCLWLLSPDNRKVSFPQWRLLETMSTLKTVTTLTSTTTGTPTVTIPPSTSRWVSFLFVSTSSVLASVESSVHPVSSAVPSSTFAEAARWSSVLPSSPLRRSALTSLTRQHCHLRRRRFRQRRCDQSRRWLTSYCPEVNRKF